MDLINRQNMGRDRTSALNVQARKKCGLGDVGGMIVKSAEESRGIRDMLVL